MGIVYRRDINGSEITSFMDSDHAGDLDDRRPLAGYVFTLAGGAISWKAFLQDPITLSSIKTEYMLLTFVVNEAIWL